MTIVIPAAGNGSRFANAGYTVPKPLLPMPGGDTLLKWIVHRLPPTDRIVIARREHEAGINEALFGYAWEGVWVDQMPDGPLDSVMRAEPFIYSAELIISYADCFLHGGAGPFLDFARRSGCLTAVVIFDDDQDRYQKTPDGVSIGGLYWFKDGSDFLRRAREIERGDSIGALDVARTYKRIAEYDATLDYIDLGVPEDYESFLAQQKGANYVNHRSVI